MASGEFAAVDIDDFTLVLTGLLDGLAVQVALGDPTVSAERATDVTMRLVSRELGFDWEPDPAARGSRGPSARVRPAAAAARRQAGGR